MRYQRWDVERRSHHRRCVWLPAKVEELEAGLAVTHDVSPTGVMMVAASTLELGAPVSITFQIPPAGQTEHHVTGRVVRVEPNESDPQGIWPYRIAVAFDGEAPELEALVDTLMRSLGGGG